MSIAETLAAANAAGVRLTLDGDDLSVESEREPPAELLDALRRDKPQILDLLRIQDTTDVVLHAKLTRDLHLKMTHPFEPEYGSGLGRFPGFRLLRCLC